MENKSALHDDVETLEVQRNDAEYRFRAQKDLIRIAQRESCTITKNAVWMKRQRDVYRNGTNGARGYINKLLQYSDESSLISVSHLKNILAILRTCRNEVEEIGCSLETCPLQQRNIQCG